MATTKAYSTQLIACYALALQLAQAHGTLGAEEYAAMIAEMQPLPDKMSRR